MISDDKELILKARKINTQNIRKQNAIKTSKYNNTPNPVATPLPPLNLSQIGKQ